MRQDAAQDHDNSQRDVLVRTGRNPKQGQDIKQGHHRDTGDQNPHRLRNDVLDRIR